MPIHRIQHAAGTITHACPACGCHRTLRIDPAAGDIAVHAECFTIGPCPECAGRVDPWTGKPLGGTWECLRRDIPAWEVGEAPHPGSLLGTTYALDRGLTSVVTEHTSGYHVQPEVVAQKKLIRALQQHPHMRAHAPLRDPADLRSAVALGLVSAAVTEKG